MVRGARERAALCRRARLAPSVGAGPRRCHKACVRGRRAGARPRPALPCAALAGRQPRHACACVGLPYLNSTLHARTGGGGQQPAGGAARGAPGASRRAAGRGRRRGAAGGRRRRGARGRRGAAGHVPADLEPVVRRPRGRAPHLRLGRWMCARCTGGQPLGHKGRSGARLSRQPMHVPALLVGFLCRVLDRARCPT
jgi:hypothetical protein